MHFGERVKAKRKALRMTETECALRCGMKLQQWNRMEKTVARPAHKTVSAVAIGLMLDVEIVQQLAGQSPTRTEDDRIVALRRVECKVNRLPADKFDAWCKIADCAAEALSSA